MAEGKNLTLDEQKISLQDNMKIALALNDMKEYHRLNKHLIYVEEKISKEKQNET